MGGSPRIRTGLGMRGVLLLSQQLVARGRWRLVPSGIISMRIDIDFVFLCRAGNRVRYDARCADGPAAPAGDGPGAAGAAGGGGGGGGGDHVSAERGALRWGEFRAAAAWWPRDHRGRMAPSSFRRQRDPSEGRRHLPSSGGSAPLLGGRNDVRRRSCVCAFLITPIANSRRPDDGRIISINLLVPPRHRRRRRRRPPLIPSLTFLSASPAACCWAAAALGAATHPRWSPAAAEHAAQLVAGRRRSREPSWPRSTCRPAHSRRSPVLWMWARWRGHE